jgi:AcrR family transcriptional regulator
MSHQETPREGRSRRSRRSREEVSEALIDAAATLFAERASGHVSVRDIATRADVNPTFVHRYFGTKRNLMRAAIEHAQRDVATTVEQMPDVVEGAAAVVHAALQEREFIATLTRATLDGMFEGIPWDSPAIRGLVERFEDELQSRGVRSRHEPRIVVTCLAAATFGYALLGGYIRHGAGLDSAPDERIEAALVEVLRDVARLAFSE